MLNTWSLWREFWDQQASDEETIRGVDKWQLTLRSDEISNIVYYNNWEDRKYTSMNFCTCVEL